MNHRDMTHAMARKILREYMKTDGDAKLRAMLGNVREAIICLLDHTPRNLIFKTGEKISTTDLQTDLRDLSKNFRL